MVDSTRKACLPYSDSRYVGIDIAGSIGLSVIERNYQTHSGKTGSIVTAAMEPDGPQNKSEATAHAKQSAPSPPAPTYHLPCTKATRLPRQGSVATGG